MMRKMAQQKNWLLKLGFDGDGKVEGHFLDDSEENALDPKGAALRMIGIIPEEKVNEVYEYLTDLVTWMAAMTDDPEASIGEIHQLARYHLMEFRDMKEMFGRFHCSRDIVMKMS